MDKKSKTPPTSANATLAEASKGFNRNRTQHSFALSYGNRELVVTGWGLVALVVITVVLAFVFVTAGGIA